MTLRTSNVSASVSGANNYDQNIRGRMKLIGRVENTNVDLLSFSRLPNNFDTLYLTTCYGSAVNTDYKGGMFRGLWGPRYDIDVTGTIMRNHITSARSKCDDVAISFESNFFNRDYELISPLLIGSTSSYIQSVESKDTPEHPGGRPLLNLIMTFLEDSDVNTICVSLDMYDVDRANIPRYVVQENSPSNYVLTNTTGSNIVDMGANVRIMLRAIRRVMDYVEGKTGEKYNLDVMVNPSAFIYTEELKAAGYSSDHGLTADGAGSSTIKATDKLPFGLGIATFDETRDLPQLAPLKDELLPSTNVRRVILNTRGVRNNFRGANEVGSSSGDTCFDEVQYVKDALSCISDDIEVVFENTIGYKYALTGDNDIPMVNYSNTSSTGTADSYIALDQYKRSVGRTRYYGYGIEEIRKLFFKRAKYRNCGFSINSLLQHEYMSRGNVNNANQNVSPERHATPNKVYDYLSGVFFKREPSLAQNLFNYRLDNGRFNQQDSSVSLTYVLYDNAFDAQYTRIGGFMRT